jgi:molecular chaperone DnaK
MSNSPTPIVGIDLGTTYSAVAYLDDIDRPKTLLNAEGDKLTPSVLLFEGNNVIVGKEAVKAMSTDMDLIAACPKRDLGQRFFHKPIGGRQYPPEALEAWILNKLRIDASLQIGDFEKVVITVPAYFDEVRRKATQDAGYMAGFEVIDIINEPTAAAVAFGFQQGFLNQVGEARSRMRVVVYDLGGGTFDTTVMEIKGAEFRTLATDGDMQLGGRDWDQRMVDYVSQQFMTQFNVDPRTDNNMLGRLWRECEDAKRTLSAREKAVLTIDFQGNSSKIEITRHKFQELTADLVDRTAFTTRQVLQAAGLSWSDIDRVLMVGGSTRMPAVREMLTKLSGQQPDHSVSPDEAVAHGAALRAGFLIKKYGESSTPIRIKNVNSHSLGVVATDPQTRRPRNATLIPRNTPLPVVARRVFQTQKPGQKSIRVEIVEGESVSPEECTKIGKCSIRELPPNLPAQTPIEVRFCYEENGRLEVHVKVQNTDKELKHEIVRENSLTQDQLNSWRKYICGIPAK